MRLAIDHHRYHGSQPPINVIDRSFRPVKQALFGRAHFDGYAHPGTADPHHCRLVDAAFGHQLLRLRCPEQEPAAGLQQEQ